jgi:hypothetical protein
MLRRTAARRRIAVRSKRASWEARSTIRSSPLDIRRSVAQNEVDRFTTLVAEILPMRTVVAASLAIALALPPTSFGQDVDKYLGTWLSTTKTPANLDLRLTITRDARGLHLDSIFYRDGVAVGSSVGVDVKLDNGIVVFHNRFVQFPVKGWKNNTDHVGVRFQGEELEWINVDKKNQHMHSLRRVSAVADQGPKPAPKVEPLPPADPKANPVKADPYVGTWKGPYPGSDKTILLKIAGSDAAGYSVEGIVIGAGGSVVGRFPTTDADRMPKSIQVDAGWDVFAGATFSGGVRIAIDRNGSGLGLAVGSNRSSLTATETSEFTKLRTS